MATEMALKLNLLELYELIGDDRGISFLYEELPGVVVTIGFQKDGSEEDEEEPKEDTKDDEPKLH